jgi:hypothetical protein
VAEFVNNGVSVMAVCERVPEVDGMIAARNVELDIFDVFEGRPAVGESAPELWWRRG